MTAKKGAEEVATTQSTPPTRAFEGWEETFFDTLSKLRNVRAACEVAGVHRSTVYKKKREVAEFAERWQLAVEDANDRIRQAAFSRGVVGVIKPIYGSQGTDAEGHPRGVGKVGEVVEYSDRALELAAKMWLPEGQELARRERSRGVDDADLDDAILKALERLAELASQPVRGLPSAEGQIIEAEIVESNGHRPAEGQEQREGE